MFRWRYQQPITIKGREFPLYAYVFGFPYTTGTLTPPPAENPPRRAAGKAPVLDPNKSLWVKKQKTGWFTHDWVSEMQPRLASGFDLAQRLIDWFRQLVAAHEKAVAAHQKEKDAEKRPDWPLTVRGLRHAVFLALRDTSGPGAMIPPTGNSLVDFCIEDWNPQPTPPTGSRPAAGSSPDPVRLEDRIRFAAGSRSFRDAVQRSHKRLILDDWRADVRAALPDLKESPILKASDDDLQWLPNTAVVDQLDSLQSGLADDARLADVVIQQWRTAIRRNAEFSFPCLLSDKAQQLCAKSNQPSEKTTVVFFRRFTFENDDSNFRCAAERGELNAECEDESILTFPQIDQSVWRPLDGLDLYRITIRDGRRADDPGTPPELEISAHVDNKQFLFCLFVGGKRVHSFHTLQCPCIRVSRRDEAGVDSAHSSAGSSRGPRKTCVWSSGRRS